jgi:hypothetical protein
LHHLTAEIKEKNVFVRFVINGRNFCEKEQRKKESEKTPAKYINRKRQAEGCGAHGTQNDVEGRTRMNRFVHALSVSSK